MLISSRFLSKPNPWILQFDATSCIIYIGFWRQLACFFWLHDLLTYSPSWYTPLKDKVFTRLKGILWYLTHIQSSFSLHKGSIDALSFFLKKGYVWVGWLVISVSYHDVRSRWCSSLLSLARAWRGGDSLGNLRLHPLPNASRERRPYYGILNGTMMMVTKIS